MSKTIIIAEVGVNHNGDIDRARKMIEVAKECGVDIVKFQTFNTEKLVSKFAPMADYQKKNLGKSESQAQMLKKLQLSEEQFIELSDFCNKTGIEFLSTAFDIESMRFLNKIQSKWKIPSGEITDYPYLVEIARTKKDIIISTGMCTLKEIEEAVNLLKQNGSGKITILHCTTEYPAPLNEINMNVLTTLKEKFNCEVGYSDHTEGLTASLIAVAMGATVIEKHFTLDKSLPGPDHKASINPSELKELVRQIREIEQIKGSFDKKPTESELKNIDVVRKSIVASKDISKGEIFTEENITTKRPGNGISPMRWNEVIGRKALRSFVEDEIIEI